MLSGVLAALSVMMAGATLAQPPGRPDGGASPVDARLQKARARVERMNDYLRRLAREEEWQTLWAYRRDGGELAGSALIALEMAEGECCNLEAVIKALAYFAKARYTIDRRLDAIGAEISANFLSLHEEVFTIAQEWARAGYSDAAKSLLKVPLAFGMGAFTKGLQSAARAPLAKTPRTRSVPARDRVPYEIRKTRTMVIDREALRYQAMADDLRKGTQKALEEVRAAQERLRARVRELDRVRQGAGAATHAARRTEALGGAAAAYSPVQDITRGLPQLRRIPLLLESYGFWLDVRDEMSRTEERLWKKLLESSPCMRAAARACPQRERPGTAERRANGGAKPPAASAPDAEFVAQARQAVERACAGLKAAATERGGCACAPAALLRQLHELKRLYEGIRARERQLDELARLKSKLIADLYIQTIDMYLRGSLPTDWFGYWTGVKGVSGGVEGLLYLTPIPFVGGFIQLGDALGRLAAAYQRAGTKDELFRNAAKARKELGEISKHRSSLSRLRDRLRKCEQDAFQALGSRCDLEADCPDDKAPVPGDRGMKVAADSGQWCSYWGWKKEVPWGPKGGFVPDPLGPPPEQGPTPMPPEEEPPAVPERPRTEERPRPPPPEKRPPVTRPPVYVKAKKAAFQSGQKAQAVAGFQLKLLAPAPALPLAGNKRDDSGYDEPPLHATTDRSGRAVFPAAQRRSDGGRQGAVPRRPRFALSFGDLIAAAHAAETMGAAPPVEVEIEVPEFDSYTVKLRVDRSRPGWDDPASYLDPPFDGYVVRHWIVGDVMYAVINVPIAGGGMAGEEQR